MQKSKQDRCKRQTTLYQFYLPSSQQIQPSLSCLPWIFCASAVFSNSDRTAVLHFIIRLKPHFLTISLLQNGLPTNISFVALRQIGIYFSAASFILICNNTLGNQIWTIFIAWMPAKRSSLLCSRTLNCSRHYEEPRLNMWHKTDHLCSDLDHGTEHWIWKELLSSQSPLVAQDKLISSLVFLAQDASITGLTWALHTPLMLENRSQYTRTLRNPENSRDEKAQWDEGKKK